MATKTIKYYKEHPYALEPVMNNAGYTLAVLGSIVLPPTNLTNRVHPLGTGIIFNIPEGYYATVSLCQEWASKTKVRMASGFEVINSGEEVVLHLENIGKYDQRILAGQYIAQVCFHKKEAIKLELDIMEVEDNV